MTKTKATIFDGAMGTELQKRGLHKDPALLNLSHPNEIIAIHQEYLAAGADVITANTFGAYSHKHDNAAELIRAAISNGRQAIKRAEGTSPFHAKPRMTKDSPFAPQLALDLGPTGLMIEPYGDTSEEECYQIFKETVRVGIDCGVDLILIETMMDLTELKLAVTVAKETSLPVFATMSFDKNGRTMMGADLDSMVSLLEGLNVDALGMNCGFGPDIYVGLATELSKTTELPIIIQPNAGMPVTEETASVPSGSDVSVRYNLTPDDFAKTMVSMNVNVMGGCCGTTPEHIAALAQCVYSKFN